MITVTEVEHLWDMATQSCSCGARHSPQTDDAAADAAPPVSTRPPGVRPMSTSAAASSPLAAALAALQAELPTITKDRTATVETRGGGSYSYTYADLAEISAQIMPKLSRHGLSFIARPTVLPNGMFVLAYALLHSSGQREGGEYPLPDPLKSTPQQSGSAITYARRYCLCAVTGVATSDDDDDARKAADRQERAAEAAAAVGREQAEQNERAQAEMQYAIDIVRGEWSRTFGAYDVNQVAPFYARWSGGRNLREAPAPQLRRFAAYLAAIPATEAGTDPGKFRIEHEQPSAEGDVREADQPAKVAKPRPMTGAMRGKLFAELSDRGIKDDQDQRDFMSELLGRRIESRAELTYGDGKTLIDWMQQNTPKTETPTEES